MRDGHDVDLYADVLQQINVRLDEAGQLLAGCPIDWSAELTLERTALHLRKVIELIALSTLIANRAELEKVSDNLKKQDADGARKLIRRVNPDYWPEPVKTKLTALGRAFEMRTSWSSAAKSPCVVDRAQDSSDPRGQNNPCQA